MENRNITIAIVDDSDIIRERLVQRIGKCTACSIIWQAINVEMTENCFTKEVPAIMILDIQLPDGSGIDVLEKVKASNADVKVIMLTNYPSPPFRRKCMEAGADYFFDKSTEFEKVFDVLKELAHKKCEN